MRDNGTIVRQFIEETINQGQIDSAAQFVWEDVVEEVPSPGQGPGLEGLKDILRDMRAVFSDLYFSVEEQIAEGDKVLTRFEWTGAHRGEFLGVPATGRSVKVWDMVNSRLSAHDAVLRSRKQIVRKPGKVRTFRVSRIITCCFPKGSAT